MSFTHIKNSRDKALELVEEGIIDCQTMLEACLNYMSVDDVSDMLYTNDFIVDEDEEEER